MTKQYIEFDPDQGYPQDDGLFYECQKCHKILPSMPEDNVWCDCYNLCIDVDAGRLAVKDNSLIRLVRITDQSTTPQPKP